MNHRLFLRFPGFRYKAVTLSYDDGVFYDEKLLEIMRKYGLKGTFNLNSGNFSRQPNGRHLTAEQAQRLYSTSGQEIAAHGVYHYPLTELSDAMVTEEILADKNTLANMFQTRVHGMAYAFGSYDDRVAGILKSCGIHYARTTYSTEKFDLPEDWLKMPATCHHRNPRLMQLVDEFLKEESPFGWETTPRLFYLWGHSYEFNDNNNWEIMENFGKKIGNRTDIWYATNGEIYDYVTAYDRLEFSPDGAYVFNPSAVAVYLSFFGKQHCIQPGETAFVHLK